MDDGTHYCVYCVMPLLFQWWEAIPHLPHSGHWTDEDVSGPAAGSHLTSLPPVALSAAGSGEEGLGWRDFWASPGVPALRTHVTKWFGVQAVGLAPWPPHLANSSSVISDCGPCFSKVDDHRSHCRGWDDGWEDLHKTLGMSLLILNSTIYSFLKYWSFFLSKSNLCSL